MGVSEARQQALARVANEAMRANINARIMARRAANEQDTDVTEEHAQTHATIAAEKQQQLEKIAAIHGVTVDEAHARQTEERKVELTNQLAQWKETRPIHQDFIDNPDFYGHCDLAGHPLNMEQQRNFLRAYDAAIAETEAELGKLG